MKSNALIFILIATILLSFKSNEEDTGSSKSGRFNVEKDLLLAQFDCKTDVDDLHSAAALSMLLSNPNYSKIKYHSVAGTYGIQEGLYVPPNDLFQLAFGKNWTDAHENLESAIKQVKVIAESTLANGGDIWIAEAGQSDFSAELVKSIQADLPNVKTLQRIHVVQHSDWNEKVTSPTSLEFIKQNTDYQKIADGNVVGNGTPGFRDPKYTDWKNKIKNPRLKEIWQLAIDLGIKYNGKEGRYNNPAVSAGGLDFSDLSETCWILGLEDIKDT
ncbi:MAG TPA: hypothetical protein VK589_14020, partial [Chryseolinea sp.]|nr:hypothetical protein [Chryseolinea sp.]